MDFRSSYLSVDGELLNLTWNATRPNGANWVKKPAPSVYEWDDAAWVMAGCFIIFGKHIMGSGIPEQEEPGGEEAGLGGQISNRQQKRRHAQKAR